MQISMHLLRIVSVLVASELFHLVCGGISAEETLSESDADFCHGGLSLMYPGLAVDRCLVVPRERSLRERLSSKWGAPQVRWEHAEKEKRYTLMMVDPDTPSRCNPTKSHWRHWLVVDIVPYESYGGQLKPVFLTFLGKLDRMKMLLQLPSAYGLSPGDMACWDRAAVLQLRRACGSHGDMTARRKVVPSATGTP